MVEFENRGNSEKRIENLELEKLKPEITNHKDFLDAICTWTGKKMTVKQWKEYEKDKMENVLLLSLHVCVNDGEKDFDLEFTSLYPGQLGLWCSELLKKINQCEMMKSEPKIVCV